MAENLQHEDFGEKIGGAKKDLWKDRGLYVDDLGAMNEREAEKFVKKDNVWKKPDYQAMLDDGVPLGVVYFIKKARDSLGASPQYRYSDKTPELRRARQEEYIETVRQLQAVIEDVRTLDDAMQVLMVEPGKVPYAAEIGEGLEPLQAAVGGDIQAVYPYDDPVALICNEEGKYMGLPLNRALHDDEGNIYDIVAGNFFLCGLGEEDFTDLPADLMEKYRQQFEHPEQFVRIAGKILAVKQPVPSPEEQEAQRAQMAAQEAQREEMRLDESTDLAFDLDVFLRQYSDAYADMHPVFHEEKERMADELLSGQTGKIRMRMATVIQEEHLNGEAGPLLDRIAAYEKEYGISAYSIYQLDLSDSTDDLRFMSLDWLEKKGLPVDRDNYQMVYAAELSPGETLEDIYTRFNIDHPEDFKGHSLSVSDVVVLHEKGSDTAYYVDSIGFKEVPDFLGGARQPEAKRDVSLRELLDDAKKQAAKAEPKTPEKKKEPERS